MHHETRPTTVHTRRLTIRESVAAIAAIPAAGAGGQGLRDFHAGSAGKATQSYKLIKSYTA
jgi:hypothetical protein